MGHEAALQVSLGQANDIHARVPAAVLSRHYPTVAQVTDVEYACSSHRDSPLTRRRRPQTENWSAQTIMERADG
jgi:hypothetical protein